MLLLALWQSWHIPEVVRGQGGGGGLGRGGGRSLIPAVSRASSGSRHDPPLLDQRNPKELNTGKASLVIEFERQRTFGV